MIKTPKRVSFAPVCQTSTGEVDPLITNQDETPTEDPTVTIEKDIEEPRAKNCATTWVPAVRMATSGLG